jgi:riboflavin synthase
MFTGIIEEVGQVVEMADSGDFRTLRVRAGAILDDMRTGASISVNGVCLTARLIHADGSPRILSHETLGHQPEGARAGRDRQS